MSNPDSSAIDVGQKIAPPPFEDVDADVIICTNDGVLFRTFKFLLSKASPHFANMFILPPVSPSSVHPSNHVEGVPVVHVTEDASTMINFLSLGHPSAQVPSLQSVYEVLQLHTTGDKYLVDSVKDFARREVSRFISSEPVSVFAVAYHLGWKEEAMKAAQASLKMSVKEISLAGGTEMDFVPAGVLKKLAEYRRECQKAMALMTCPAYWYAVNIERDIDCQMNEGCEPIIDVKQFPVREWGSLPFSSQCCCTPVMLDDSSGWRDQFDGPFMYGQLPFELQALPWFAKYYRELRAALQDIPGREDVDSAIWMKEALKEAKTCPECGLIAFTILQALSIHVKEGASRSIVHVQLYC